MPVVDVSLEGEGSDSLLLFPQQLAADGRTRVHALLLDPAPLDFETGPPFLQLRVPPSPSMGSRLRGRRGR